MNRERWRAEVLKQRNMLFNQGKDELQIQKTIRQTRNNILRNHLHKKEQTIKLLREMQWTSKSGDELDG